MDFETLFRLLGLAVSMGTIIYVVLFIHSRFVQYRKGKNIIEKPTSTKDPVLSRPDAYIRMRKRMAKDRLSIFIHNTIIVGLVISVLSHVFSVLNRTIIQRFVPVWLQSIFTILSIFSFVLGGLLLLSATSISLLRRLMKKPDYIGRKLSEIMPLIALILIAISGFMYNNAMHPITNETMRSPGTLNIFLIVARLFHVLSMAWYIFLIPRSNLFHMIITIKLLRKGIPVISGRIKDSEQTVNSLFSMDKPIMQENFGISRIYDLSPTQLMQLDNCVGCGLCETVCPASLSGKSLSPKKLISLQKKYLDKAMYSKQEYLTDNQELINISYQCAMCYACETACPSFVEHVDKIVDIRRNLVLKRGLAPKEWKSIIKSCERTTNIFGSHPSEKQKLISELQLPLYEKGMDVSFVLWIGCYGYFDPRMKNVITSLIQLCKKVGKSIAVLKQEKCCGEMLRRVGEEYKFQELAHENIKVFEAYGINSLLVVCPHCYNTLKHEYRSFGSTIDVLHYLEILPNLIESLYIVPPDSNTQRIAYHDSCYLARLNNLCNEPRTILKAFFNNLKLIPLEHEKQDTLCCGGGGGRIVMEEDTAERAATARILELKQKEIHTLLTSCPYCLNMFQDAVLQEETNMKVKDLLEVLNEYSLTKQVKTGLHPLS